MGPQSCKSMNLGNFEITIRESWDKMTFGCGHVAMHREYYGGRWWLPPSSGCNEFCEFVFAHGSSVDQKCSNYALINLLFGWCRAM
jgi:hypothetical protein